MSFYDRVNDLVSDFYKINLIKPNELWLGHYEVIQLENFINENSPNLKEPIRINYEDKFEFIGLKVRFVNKINYFSVEYNQYY